MLMFKTGRIVLVLTVNFSVLKCRIYKKIKYRRIQFEQQQFLYRQ